MNRQTELTFIGEIIPGSLPVTLPIAGGIRAPGITAHRYAEKSPYGKWTDIVIDKTNGQHATYGPVDKTPTVRWTVWFIGNYNSLSSKFPDISLFCKHFEMELTKLKEHGQCVLVYDTEKKPFKEDPYLKHIEDISIRLRVYLFHYPCNLLRCLQMFTRTNRKDLFMEPKGLAMSFCHGSPYLRYQQKRGDNNRWDIYSKDPSTAQWYA